METPRIGDRLTAPETPPDDDALRDWVGACAFGLWSELRGWIGSRYPGVFAPDWIHDGKWLKIDVTSAEDLQDVTDLLILKRPGRITTG